MTLHSLNDVDEGLRVLRMMTDEESDFQPPGIEAGANKPLYFFEVHTEARRVRVARLVSRLAGA